MQWPSELPIIETHSFSEQRPIPISTPSYSCFDRAHSPHGEYDFSGRLAFTVEESNKTILPSLRDKREFLTTCTRYWYKKDGTCEVIVEHYLGI